MTSWRGAQLHKKAGSCIREILCQVMDWIQLAQYSVQWRAVLNTMMTLPLSMIGGEFIDQLSDYQLLRN
jgi:hypothetical protein